MIKKHKSLATHLFLFIGFFLIANTLVGQRKISIDSVQYYIGKEVIVCGKVYSTKTDAQTGTVFLDMGGKYPNAKLTIVIFQADLKNFKINPEFFYKDKQICITGEIKEYKSKIQIVVRQENMIQIELKKI